MNVLTEPLQYAYFRHGLEAGIIAGGLCGLIGVYVVLRHMSYIGHGLAHAIFGGAVASYVMQVNYYVGAGLWGVGAALLITVVGRRRQIGADAAIGIVTTASFAAGVALISRVNRFSVNLEAALFGNILGVTTGQILVLLAVSLFTVGAVFLRYRQILFATFDPEVADAYGVNTKRIDVLFSLILAATIVSSLQVLGATLIAATVVIPAVVARLLTDSFWKMLIISTVVGISCGAIGMYVSYYVDIASGAAIVLTMTAVFAVVFIVTGIVSRRRLRLVDDLEQVDVAGGVAVHAG